MQHLLDNFISRLLIKHLVFPFSSVYIYPLVLKVSARGFPGGLVVKNLPASVEDTGSIPGLGQSHMLQSN